MLLHILHGAANSRDVWRQKADERDEQHTGVGERRAVRLDEGIDVRVERFCADIGMNLVAHGAPVVDRSVESKRLGALDRAVESNPSHDLRVSEVARRAAYFPDTMVRLIPDLLQTPGERFLERPGFGDLLDMTDPRLMERVHYLAIHVELDLLVRRIPDPDRFRVLIPGEPWNFPLTKQALPGNSIH